MAMTEFALGDALAVQRWSKSLAVEAAKKQYFIRFMGRDETALIKVLDDLNNKPGEKITYALRLKLTGEGVTGDNTIEGTTAEESMSFYYASLYIDQLRKGTKSKGQMSEQRVPYNMRREGRDALATWWAETYDAFIMMYLSGARGVDTSLPVGLSWTGFANNSFLTPNSDNQLFGGNATSSADIDSNDKISVDIFERLKVQATVTDPMIQPFNVMGNRKFVVLMHPFQTYQLRTSISENDWLQVHKATDNMRSPIYTGALGEWADLVLHEHRNVVRFSTYGSTGNLPAARALFLGAQAGVIAWARNGGPNKYKWNEEMDDRGNALAITAGAIFGVQKNRYSNGKDFSVIAVDTYAANPNS